MKRFLFFGMLLTNVAFGQKNFEAYNTLSFSTNPLRPLMGIVDFNVHVPTTENQSIVAGVHHYSFFYVYDRANSPTFLNSYGEKEYSEWVRGNTLAADYRWYLNTSERRRNRATYITVLNRAAFVKRRYTNDIIDNPLYVDQPDPSDPNYDPEWNDGVGGEPLFLPASYDNLESRTSVRYRFGAEYGRRTLSRDGSRFKELGVAFIFNLQGEWFFLGMPTLTYRIGF